MKLYAKKQSFECGDQLVLIDGLPKMKAPAWMMPLLQVKRALKNSCFYPGAGLDFYPLELLKGRLHSFVYADFGVSREEVTRAVQSLPDYDVVLLQTVQSSALGPEFFAEQSWQEHVEWLIPRITPFFALWVILEPKSAAVTSRRVSLLYIGGDAIATFRALYLAHNCAPKVIALVQYGYGWTDFRDPGEPLAQEVLANAAGAPTFLLEGGVGDANSYQQPCWPEFSKLVRSDDVGHQYRLWRRP